MTTGVNRKDRARAKRERERRDARGRAVRRWAFPAIFVIATIAIGVVVVASAISSRPGPASRSTRPSLGSAAAPVLVAEYGDFQCPSCGAWARSVEVSFRTAFVDTGRVRMEWHDFPWIGPESRAAANAARCAGAQNKFWPYHDLLYANQGGENTGAFPKSRLKAFGGQVNLDATTFDACIDGGTYDAAVQAELSAATAKGLTGTPTFEIGGQRLVGPPTLDALRAAIVAAGG